MAKIVRKKKKTKSETRKTVFFLLMIAIAAVSFSVVQTRFDLFQGASEKGGRAANWKEYDNLIESGNIPKAEKILEIVMRYDEAAVQKLQLQNVKVKNGYSPKSDRIQGSAYSIKVFDLGDNLVHTENFEVPLNRDDSPPEPGSDDSTEKYLHLNSVNLAVTIPWSENYASIELYDSEGSLLAERKIPGIQKVNNKPNFKLKNAQEILIEESATSPYIPSAYAATSDGEYADIVFIGNAYTSSEISKFHSDVDRFVSHILTYEPYKTRASQIRFGYVDNSADLGCVHDGDRLGWCDDAKVIQAINSAGALYDKIYVIWNTTTYTGSGGAIGVSYNGSWGPQHFAHEFGHSFAKLSDEYIANYAYAAKDKNCYADTPPNPAWSGIVNSSDYYAGCNYSNWYRSSVDSVMNHLDAEYYNPISQQHINSSIDYYAGSFVFPSATTTPTSAPSPTRTPTAVPIATRTPTPVPSADITNPTVSITKPKSNATIKKNSNVTITAVAKDNVGLAKVEFYINNVLACIDSTASYTCTWKAPNTSNATYNLRATAFDKAGNTSSTSINVKAR